MITRRPSPVFDRQYPDCPGCGRDLKGLDRAIFCPGCGRQLQFKSTARDRFAAAAAVVFHSLTFNRLRQVPPPPDTSIDRAPILIGYSIAMFKLGFRYERGSLRNLGEALRCYRKSGRLGNPDAKARLTGDAEPPARVLPINR